MLEGLGTLPRRPAQNPSIVQARVFFFLLWPLFARAPRHWFLENFLLSAPGVQSVFFFVALRWAPRPFGRARAKKKHHPGCFVFAAAPAKSKGRRSPVGRRKGARAKKKTPPRVVFFAPAPGKGRGRRSPVGRRHGARFCYSFPCLSPGPQQKKKTPWVVFLFLLRPRADAHSLTAGLGGDASPSPGWCFFFCCGPAGSF